MAASQPTYRADLSYSESITADKLTVKFDGVLYQVEKDARGGYGNRGLKRNAGASGLPFYIVRGDGVNGVFTTSAGQHTIEISEDTSKIETTECFKKAVQSVVGGSSSGGGGTEPLVVKAVSLTDNGESRTLTYSHSWQEINDALMADRPCYFGSLPLSSADALGSFTSVEQIRDVPVMFPITMTRLYEGAYKVYFNDIQQVGASISTSNPTEPLTVPANR